MRVRFLKHYATETTSFRTGEHYVLPMPRAEGLIRAGIAIAAPLPDIEDEMEEQPEAAIAEPPKNATAEAPETASRRKGGRR